MNVNITGRDLVDVYPEVFVSLTEAELFLSLNNSLMQESAEVAAWMRVGELLESREIVKFFQFLES